MNYVRKCPRCGGSRSLDEMVCQGDFKGHACHWPLMDILPEAVNSIPLPAVVETIPSSVSDATRRCRNGHDMDAEDFMCMLCGEPMAIDISPTIAPSVVEPTVVQGWNLGAELPVISGESDLRMATHETHGTGVFKHYRRGIEPETALYPALHAMDATHALRLLDSGRHEGRAFEVWEFIPLGTLAAIPNSEKARHEFVREVVKEIGNALHALAEVKLIHRDLKHANVLVRSLEPLDLVLADFSTASVSEFDLQLTMTRQTVRYAAPETIAGTCSTASDWWSFGVMIMEMLTEGRGFEGVHERAYLLHLVTRGLLVPTDLPEEWRELLMGLLARDPSVRWQWSQVERWLNGERGIPHGYTGDTVNSSQQGASIQLAGRSWNTPESFCLAAADTAGWDEAKELLLGGNVATWLQERSSEKEDARTAQVRNITVDQAMPEDARLALALLVLNANLPLCLRGEIVSPSWVLIHPETAMLWLDSSLPTHLRRMERETWFVRLRERADRVRQRIRESNIECDATQLSAALLATSTQILETRWKDRRKFFPEADHSSLAALLERRSPSEEELIILVSASPACFRTTDEILEEADREALRAQVTFNHADANVWWDMSRREILDTLNERLKNFVRCGRETADQWADDFRQDRRISLARALVLLSIAVEDWREPPRQEYDRNVLDFFHRRLVTGLQRGGLVRMTIGKTTARVDLTELSGPMRTSEALLSAILTRRPKPAGVDPNSLLNDPSRENRLRRLWQNATAYRRDTGINALYLGFPFVVLRDARASEATKPRIAPVLLWPVRLEMPSGSRGNASLCFDADRPEVRINPALEGLLGSAAPAWREILDDIRGRENLDLQETLDALSTLATVVHTNSGVTPLPPATSKVAAGSIQLHASAVLFNSDFTGQTIAEDLKQLTRKPIQGTALEVAIRAGESAVTSPKPTLPAEVDRYFTAASDPSQQDAVFKARQAPGLVVQGPPGTGKSQTIVNIVCDAIGRGERVLIVCQKLAALEVVQKRLEAEGLSDRLFFLKDALSDRKPALLALRRQLDQTMRTPAKDAQLKQNRESLARHIESLESEFNTAHRAMREVIPEMASQLPYREILERLMAIEKGIPPVSYAPIGGKFRALDHSTADRLIAEIAPLTPLWRDAKYESSPLHCLINFRTDETTIADFRRAVESLQVAELHRFNLLQQGSRFYEIDSPEVVTRWLTNHETTLRTLPLQTAQSLAKWSHIFSPASPGDATPAEQLLPWLQHLDQEMKTSEGWILESSLYEKISTRGNGPLERLAKQARLLDTPPRSLFERFSPTRWFARRRMNQWLKAAGVAADGTDLTTLALACELELRLRPERVKLHQWNEALDGNSWSNPPPLPKIRSAVKDLINRLSPAMDAAKHLQSCPLQEVAADLRDGGDPQVFGAVLDGCRASLELWNAVNTSLQRLESAAPWFDAAWVEETRSAIKQRKGDAAWLSAILQALPTLQAFQAFRLRASSLNPIAFPLLSMLRERDEIWQRMSDNELPTEISRTLQREALLAWKSAAEEACPSLTIDRSEFESKVQLLAEKDAAMTQANQEMLAQCSAASELGTKTSWEDVVMLSGARARRLREVVERGAPLGLFHLRPVWMVNPEMVSRLFPLQAGLFDLVIFDEASQLPVECTLPALFRSRRVVVSGDEKQMPPSRFFGSQLDSDEEEEGDELSNFEREDHDEEARERQAQAAGRREVKDCTDLLSLSQNLLPTATLEIHYRSKYRQLIEFSNAAFYAGRLNIPARHPASEVERARPIEVDRINGVYRDQTNDAEAERIVARLRELWLRPANQRPSLGVVTFNLKQADLIQDKLEALAEVDEAFRLAWQEEQTRSQRGEDMGFFVKNLENVQGDERDWILFSTTFGRDAKGTFRRNFGVLGQQGGERRLNVAITRAREKLIIVTSMPVAEISHWQGAQMRRPPTIPRDYLQAWLRHGEHVSAAEFQTSTELLTSLDAPAAGMKRREVRNSGLSVFENEVASFLKGCGYEPQQASGDAFGVDFALLDPRTGLFGIGIECDAVSHPMLQTARARELWRPEVLRSSIPVLHRVTSRAWYHDRQQEQARLKAAVEAALNLS